MLTSSSVPRPPSGCSFTIPPSPSPSSLLLSSQSLPPISLSLSLPLPLPPPSLRTMSQEKKTQWFTGRVRMLHVCTSWSSTFQVRCRRGGGHSRQSAGLRTRADANGSRYADMQLKGQESWQRPRAALVCAPGTEARPQRRTLAAKSFTKSIFCLPRRGRFLRRFLASPARTAGRVGRRAKEGSNMCTEWATKSDKREGGYRQQWQVLVQAQAHFVRGGRRHTVDVQAFPQVAQHAVPSDHRRSAAEGGSARVRTFVWSFEKCVRTASRRGSHLITERQAECSAEGVVSHRRAATRRGWRASRPRLGRASRRQGQRGRTEWVEQRQSRGPFRRVSSWCGCCK